MALFGKKSPTGTPTNIIIQMRQQGLSNDQIIQNLQREGYSSGQIFDAMNQADIRGVVEAEPQEQQPNPMPQQEMPPQEPIQEQPQMPPQTEELPPPEPEMMPASPTTPNDSVSREEIEEIVEPIIDEKWEELMKGVDKIITWKETTESKIVKIEQQIQDLKNSFEELHRGILAKVGEYDKGIKEVGSDIKAMETVFKKALPTFTDNVSELSRITKKLKK